jgi:hypothetical protein
MSLLVRLSTDPGALLVRDTDDPLALAVTESTSPLALRVQESTSPLAQRVRGLFSPSQLPGLAAWYDAADSSTVLTTVGPDVPATNGQTVRRWLDKSGNNRHLDQAVLANQALFSGGQLDFDGSNDFYTATYTPAPNPPITLYYVCTPTDFSADRYMGFGPSGTVLDAGWQATTGRMLARNGLTPVGPIATAGVRAATCYLFDGTNSVLRLNNNESVVSVGTNVNAVTTAIVGATNSGGAAAFLGQIGEVLVYSSTHDLPTRNRVIEYLTRRWGITA